MKVVLALAPLGGLVSQEKLHKRFEMFASGRWATAAILRRRRRRRSDNVEDRRVSKVLGFVQMGELSAGRAVLEAAELALGTNANSCKTLYDDHPARGNPCLNIC